LDLKGGLSSLKLCAVLNKNEEKILHAMLPVNQRARGMHLYAEQPDVKERIAQIVAEEEKQQAQPGGLAVPHYDSFLLAANAKAKIWNELATTEKQQWRDQSKAFSRFEFMSSQ
jgi:hypothetical protein